MNPNPRIHRPNARSYVTSYSPDPTITQSTALWKAMRHREELERREAENHEALAAGGVFTRLRHVLSGLPFIRKQG